MNVSSIVVEGRGAKLTCRWDWTVVTMGAGGVVGITLRGGAMVDEEVEGPTLRGGALVPLVIAACGGLSGAGVAIDVRTSVS